MKKLLILLLCCFVLSVFLSGLSYLCYLLVEQIIFLFSEESQEKIKIGVKCLFSIMLFIYLVTELYKNCAKIKDKKCKKDL